jgi:esterase/lipase
MEATQKVLPDVTADVLLFQGRRDHEVPAKKAKEILNRLGSRRKDLIWLDHSFHEIPRDHDSLRVLRTIRDQIADSR